MQSAEEKRNYNKVISLTCYITDLLYLLLHIVYLIFFIISKSYAMIVICSFGIWFYLLLISLLVRARYYEYALCCGFEFLIISALGTILLGFNTGFHLVIIGLSVVSFFTAYFSNRKNVIVKSIVWIIVSILLYLFLFLYSSFNEPYYHIEKWEQMSLFIIHIFVNFGFITGYLSIFTKYAKQLEKTILLESRIDNLTLLHNRYDLYNYLDSLANKNDYVLAMFDIDDFKKINDEYGHVCGDFILKEVATIAKNSIDDSFVARYGGEEFVVIIEMFSDYNQAIQKLEKIRTNIEKHNFVYENQTIKATITIGVQEYSNNIDTQTWINQADAKLYKGKNNGKNQTVK